MTGFLVTCESCGFQWVDSNAIDATNSTNITLVGTRVGPCPRCGGWGRIPDGVYDFDARGVISAFRGLNEPDLRKVQALLKEQQAGTLGHDEALAQVAAVSQQLADLMERFSRQPQWTAPVVLQVLLAVIAVVLAWMALHPSTTLTEADHEALEHDVRQAIEQTAPAASPLPLPRGATVHRQGPWPSMAKAARPPKSGR